jgi:hypothetical protein
VRTAGKRIFEQPVEWESDGVMKKIVLFSDSAVYIQTSHPAEQKTEAARQTEE